MNATATPTVDLTEWVPALAEEIHGKNWSPNMDTITHLEAQRHAHTLGISWARVMPVTDVEKLKTAMRDMYVGRRARATKRK